MAEQRNYPHEPCRTSQEFIRTLSSISEKTETLISNTDENCWRKSENNDNYVVVKIGDAYKKCTDLI